MPDPKTSTRRQLESKPSDQFDPDRPQRMANRDRLGFRILAKRLAASMLRQSPTEGYVIGIEGTWGSGKTTLINFLLEELRADTSNPPQTVKFDPWVVGEKDRMLAELMADLASAVDAINASKGPSRKRLQKDAGQLASRLKTYASKLSKTTAPLAHLAGMLGVPFATLAGGVLGGVASAADAMDLTKTVDQVKSELLEDLRKLPKRIVVVVDDLDRLEPPKPQKC